MRERQRERERERGGGRERERERESAGEKTQQLLFLVSLLLQSRGRFPALLERTPGVDFIKRKI